MDPNELVTVYTCSNAIEANILRNALTDEEIECFLQNENQARLMVLPINLQVPAEQAAAAREFLAEHDRMRANRTDSDDDAGSVEESIAPVDA